VKSLIKVKPRKIYNTVVNYLDKNSAVLQWATEGIIKKNWGDKLNPYLIKVISGKRVFHRSEVYPWPPFTVHYCVGSHLSTAMSDPNASIWGSGFISYDAPVIGRPKAIHAVRGWLSVSHLKENGVEPPSVVGDPALLLPRFYSPKPSEKNILWGLFPIALSGLSRFIFKRENGRIPV